MLRLYVHRIRIGVVDDTWNWWVPELDTVYDIEASIYICNWTFKIVFHIYLINIVGVLVV